MCKNSNNTNIKMDNADLLINAIIEQAVHDYRHAKSMIRKIEKSNPDGIFSEADQCEISKYKSTIGEVGRFLLSDYFYFLTNVPGKAVLERLEREQHGKRRYKGKTTNKKAQ